MKKFLVLILYFLLNSVWSTKSGFDYVSTFIGSAGQGYGVGSLPPGVQDLFGMTRLTPDTALDNVVIPWEHNGGYYYGDNEVLCFSHTHTYGAGLPFYGNIGVIPTDKAPQIVDTTTNGWRSTFSHSNEFSEPGFYQVFLQDPQINVSLSATTNVGAHHYEFTKYNSSRIIVFDISHTIWGDQKNCHYAKVDLSQIQQNLISGVSNTREGYCSRVGGCQVYFDAEIQTNLKLKNYAYWNDNQMFYNSPVSVNRTNSGSDLLRLEPQQSTDIIDIIIGISFISIEQARLNRLDQAKKTNNMISTFENIKQKTQNNWKKALNQVIVEGSNNTEDLVKFYSALYQSFAAPTTFSESGGKYLGFDQKVHSLEGSQRAYYTDLSIWDIYRTQIPFLGIIKPSILRDIVNSLILQYEQGGDLPKWPLANGYTGGMIGQHANIIIADAYFKGIQDFNVQKAYEGMKQGATKEQKNCGRTDLPDYINLGFIPFENSTKGSCLTQAYAYDDYVLGKLAASLNYSQDSEKFLKRSENWKNVWNDEYKFFCPKSRDGKWQCPPTWINVFDERYTEGDAWHYRFLVPHNTPGLVKAFGSNETFVDALYRLMERSELDPFNILPNPYYWAGNEEDLLSPWLFNYASRADYTQRFTRYQTEIRYTTQPDGIPGNCDYAAMSAWYLFASLGFYPVSGTPTFILGSPMFPKVTLFREDNTTFTIIANNAGSQNVYVEKAEINGIQIDLKYNAFIDFHEFTLKNKNSVIEFWMTDQVPSFYTQK